MIKEHLEYWYDKDGNKVYGDPAKFNKNLVYLMDNDPKKVVSPVGLRFRKLISPLCRMAMPLTTKNKFKIVKPYELDHDMSTLSLKEKIHLHKQYKIPKGRPVVFAATHGFRDDIALTIKAAGKHAYVLYGSIPDFFYSIDGKALWLVGTVLADRKDHESTAASLPKMERVLDLGGKVIIYPEGVWNKSPNKLVLDLYSGAYRLAKKKNGIVVPISTIQVDNTCYAVRHAPFDITKYSQEEGIDKLREILATGKYKLMKKFASISRVKIGNADEYWHNFLDELIATSNGLYDYEIEDNAEYKKKDVVDAEEVFAPIDNIKVNFSNAFVYAKTRNINKKRY